MRKALASQSNPFSTRFVKPGAIEYLFSAGWCAQRVIETIAANNWRGAIVGPHGSGKSTLLATLKPHVERLGTQTQLISLHNGERWFDRRWATSMSQPERHPADSISRKAQGWPSLGLDFQSARGPFPPCLLIIDGYEQLNQISRWLADCCCRRRGWGLLVTTHSPVSLPTVFEAKPSFEVLKSLLARLISPNVAIITQDDAVEAYAQAHGNLREALFTLYDRYQERATDSNRTPLSSVKTK
jgi:hypothetical protein